jgi:hypothetical protein
MRRIVRGEPLRETDKEIREGGIGNESAKPGSQAIGDQQPVVLELDLGLPSQRCCVRLPSIEFA